MDGNKRSEKENKGMELKEWVHWTWVNLGDERVEECWEVRRRRDGNDDGREKCGVERRGCERKGQG